MSLKKRSIQTIIIVASTTVTLILGVWFVLTHTVDKVVRKEARITAIHWQDYFHDNLDNIETMIATGVPDISQSDTIDMAVNFGEVFRFKIFRPDGTVSLVSDEYKFRSEGYAPSDVNEKAINVYRTGISHVKTGDGREKPNRPDVYVEAYVPIISEAGERIGVAEVYVDQTEKTAVLVESFSWIALFLPIFCAFFYLLPTLALLKKSKAARSAKAEADHLANFDALTGLLNRRSFKNLAPGLFKRKSTISSMYVDIDDFKRINDEHGHDGGDAFLQTVGHILKTKLGDNALVARFGGDEFVACIGDISQEELHVIAQDILESVARGTTYKGKTITGNISVGLCVAGSDEPLSNLLNAADTALYRSKEKGKNTVTFFSDELNNEFRRQRQLENLLRSAVDGEGLELFFQPINQPGSQKILGFEALLRLNDEQGKTVYPDEFIPMAERLGLITEIGKWVLTKAIITAKKWPENIFVSVNLSAIQFDSGDLPNFIESQLFEHKYPASRLEVEVTESLLILDEGSVEAQLSEIKNMGVSIALDDFGTGYSSLGYLWKYEFDKLKIDRSFLLGHDQNPEKLEKVIETIVNLGHGIDMTVTVEGVESNKHVNVLKSMNCDQLQGYYFGKPMTTVDVDRMIADENIRELNTLRVEADKMKKAAS